MATPTTSDSLKLENTEWISVMSVWNWNGGSANDNYGMTAVCDNTTHPDVSVDHDELVQALKDPVVEGADVEDVVVVLLR